MSQNETVEELDTTVTEEDVATSTDDNEEDNTTSDDEITYEQAMKWKKDSESLQKANKKIAAMEKGVKKSPETVTWNLSEDELDALLEKRDFYKGNSQAKELRDEIEAMVTASKWKVDRSKAFELLSWDAEIEENRKVYSRSTVEGWNTSTAWFSPIAIDKYDKLSASEQEEYNSKSTKAKGGVVFK